VQTLEHCPLEVEITLETGPSVVYDAAILPAGSAASNRLAQDPRALEFIRDQYRHGKALLALGSGIELLDTARIPRTLPDGGADPGLVIDGDPHEALAAFKAAVARHRVWTRETDPPRV
jgi:catalase